MAKSHSPKFLAIVDAARGVISECDADGLRTMMDDGNPFIVLDVREPVSYTHLRAHET